MRRRVRVFALVLLAVLASPARADVHVGVQPVGASTSTALRIDATSAYLLTFTALREVSTVGSRVELIASVYRCRISTKTCDEVAEQTDALPSSAFRVARDGRSASLRATWSGLPISITWSPRGRMAMGESLTVGSADGLHHQEWGGGYTRFSDAAVTRLLGGSCHDGGNVYTGKVGSAEDYVVSGASHLPRAESLRSRLAATAGRCFNPQ